MEKCTHGDRASPLRESESVKAAGCVIARQRPGTTKGINFLSIEMKQGS